MDAVESVKESDIAICRGCYDSTNSGDGHVNNLISVLGTRSESKICVWQLDLSEHSTGGKIAALTAWFDDEVVRPIALYGDGAPDLLSVWIEANHFALGITFHLLNHHQDVVYEQQLHDIGLVNARDVRQANLLFL